MSLRKTMGAFRWILLVIAASALVIGALRITNFWPNRAEEAGPPLKQLEPSPPDDGKKKEGELSQNYLKGVPEGKFLLDDKRPETREEIQFWEDRITQFIVEKAPETPSQGKIHQLAVYTASLVTLLKEAKQREASGLEPFTGTTGFNTMALVMTLEKEFENRLGCTFSEFFASQDEDELKSLLDPE